MAHPLAEHQDEFDRDEAKAWGAIQKFKEPKSEWFDRLHDLADYPMDKLTAVFDGTSAAQVVGKVVDRVLRIVNSGACYTVRREHILSKFRDEGHQVSRVEDVRDLPFEAIDDAIGRLRWKYKAAAMAEGFATGVAGLPGMLIDIPALVSLSLRAINEYATYHGFDTTRAEERKFTLLVLSVAAASTDESRARAIEVLEDAARTYAEQGAGRGAESLPDATVQDIAEALVIRLLKGKLSQTVPLVGGLIGGGYNRSFIKEICETALRAYQERWLLDRYTRDTDEALAA